MMRLRVYRLKVCESDGDQVCYYYGQVTEFFVHDVTEAQRHQRRRKCGLQRHRHPTTSKLKQGSNHRIGFRRIAEDGLYDASGFLLRQRGQSRV